MQLTEAEFFIHPANIIYMLKIALTSTTDFPLIPSNMTSFNCEEITPTLLA